MFYTVAVKYRNRPVQLCGEYDTRAEAERNASGLRAAWAKNTWAAHIKPTSIRVRAYSETRFPTLARLS
jgi:hypothetical protein